MPGWLSSRVIAGAQPTELFAVRPSVIEILHVPTGHELRVGSVAEISASRPFETDDRVSCVIPGHHIAGAEYYADRLAIDDDPFEWQLNGNCAYVSTFAYSGRYRLEEDRWVTRVDRTWNDAWTDGVQAHTYERAGNRLAVYTPWLLPNEEGNRLQRMVFGFEKMKTRQ